MIATRPSCLARVRAAYGSLRDSERRVADWVLSLPYPQRVLERSIRQVAAQAGVSEASVLRFCIGVGYRGYKEFKLALAVDLLTVGGGTSDLSSRWETHRMQRSARSCSRPSCASTRRSV